MNAPAHGHTLDFIQSMLTENSGKASGSFKGLEVKSAFQPVFSLPHKRAIGFDASLRGTDPQGKSVGAQTLFGQVDDYSETSLLDLLCTTIHVHNFFAGSKSGGLLFVNLRPEVFLDSDHTTEFLVALFGSFGIPEGRLVIDIPGAVLNDKRLSASLEQYRQLGCLISIDDFGVDNSDLDTIWDTAPTVVKMGRSVIADAATDERARSALTHVVSLMHEMGTLVLMESVETEMEAQIAIDADADFACGFFFGDSFENLADYVEPTLTLENIWKTFKTEPVSLSLSGTGSRALLSEESLHSAKIRELRNASPDEINRYREERRPYIGAIQHVASLVKSGDSLESGCGKFFALPDSIRCYMLDADGKHMGANIISRRASAAQSVDFNSLAAPSEPDWSRREFFRRALNEPEIVQVTRRYPSLGGHTHCVTFSVGTSVQGKPVVVCGDVDWSSHTRVGQ
jgi:EAL domain-containing protein (putative c-di-GMP-specific phosphodiesterase class I)